MAAQLGSRGSKLAGLATAVALAVAGCGNAGVANSASGLTNQQRAIESQADRIVEQISGNADEKDAGEYLSHLGLNQPIATCMKKAGFNYHSDFLTLWSGYQVNGTAGRWLGKLGIRPSDAEVFLARTRPAEFAPAKTKLPRGYSAALDECQSAADGVNLAALGKPKETEALSGASTQMMEEVEQALGPLDDYTACMAKHGIDLSGIDTEGAEALHLFLSGRMPNPPLPGKKPSQGWTDYLKLEAGAVEAEESCRAKKYAQGLDLLADKLDQFQVDHANALADTAEQWRLLERKAAAAGLNN